MKKIITTIIASVSLALLSLAVPAAASTQAVQTAQTAQTPRTSDSTSPYVTFCVSAIKDAVRDADVDNILEDVLHIPKAAKLYDIYTTGSDEAVLLYDLKGKKIVYSIFDVSRVLYDFLGQLPVTGKFWSIGTPATSCLEAAVFWDIQTGATLEPQILKIIAKWLPRLLPAAPTGLTVRADPNNGTVLLLTWQDHATNETSFEVNNGVVSRSAPAHPGTGMVNYTWTGLKPGSWTCFRVRAANALGDSAWAPNAAPWYQCAYSSSPKPTANTCVFVLPNQTNCTSSNPQITLEGENVGDTSACTFSEQITWGDGSQQTVQVPGADNQPSFVANHTYRQKGTFSITLVPTVLSGSCTSFSGSYQFTYS